MLIIIQLLSTTLILCYLIYQNTLYQQVVQELQDSNAKYLNLQHQLQLLQSKLEAVQQASADTAAVVSPIKAVTPYVYTS